MTRKRLVPSVVLAAVAMALLASSSFAASEDLPGYAYAADDRTPDYPLPVEGGGYIGAASVFGPDERVRITDTAVYPWSAIAWLGIFDTNGDLTGSCTGTFIGPKVLLTAAHCLFDEHGFATDIVVVPGKDGPLDPFGFEFATNWWVPDAWIESADPTAFDWGLVVLESDALGNEVGWLRVANLSTATLSHSQFMPAIVGYPSDKSPADSMWAGVKPSFLEVAPFFLHHDIDTMSGGSGSAVFSANLDSPNLGDIVGIHVLGGPQSNRASRIDQGLLADLLEGCFQMECEFAFTEEIELPTPSATSTPTAAFTPTQTPTLSPTSTPPPSAMPPSPPSTPGANRPFRGILPLLSRD